MSSTVKYRRKSIKFRKKKPKKQSRKKKPKKQSRKKKILGGLHTVNQSKIGNCLSHADARCIYRIFKTLANENKNLFTDNIEGNSPFYEHQINYNSQHTELFPQFIKINQMLTPSIYTKTTPSIYTKTTPLEILKEILNPNNSATIIEMNDFIEAINNLHEKNNIIKMMKYKIQNPSLDFNKNVKFTTKNTTTETPTTEMTYNEIIKNNLNDTMLYSIWEKITNEKIQKIQEIQKTQEKQDFELCKTILTGLQIFPETQENPENQENRITNEEYEKMLKVQNDQKDVYFTLLPILMYKHYIVDNRTLKYKNCKNDTSKCEIEYDVKDVSTLKKDTSTIIKDKHYFIEANETYFPNEFPKSGTGTETDYMTYINNQIAKYEELMKFIPEDKVIKLWDYNYLNETEFSKNDVKEKEKEKEKQAQSIDNFINDKNANNNKLFGIFAFSSDMTSRIKNTPTTTSTTTKTPTGHAVAIENIEPITSPEYTLTYKNSWGIKYADDGRPTTTIKKANMSTIQDENSNIRKDRPKIIAWSLEDKNDTTLEDQEDQNNQTYAQKVYYYFIKDKK